MINRQNIYSIPNCVLNLPLFILLEQWLKIAILFGNDKCHLGSISSAHKQPAKLNVQWSRGYVLAIACNRCCTNCMPHIMLAAVILVLQKSVFYVPSPSVGNNYWRHLICTEFQHINKLVNAWNLNYRISSLPFCFIKSAHLCQPFIVMYLSTSVCLSILFNSATAC